MSLNLGDLRSLEQTLSKLQGDVTIVYFTEVVNCRHCRQERELLIELADLSHKLHLEVYNFTADRDVADQYEIDKVPGFVLVGKKDYGIRYFGMPSDFEFQALLEDLVRVSSGQSGLSPDIAKRLDSVSSPLHLEVLTTPGCPFSARAMRLVHQMAMENDFITGDVVNVDDFPEVAKGYKVLAAPTVVVNEDYLFYGAFEEPEFVENVLRGSQVQKAV